MGRELRVAGSGDGDMYDVVGYSSRYICSSSLKHPKRNEKAENVGSLDRFIPRQWLCTASEVKSVRIARHPVVCTVLYLVLLFSI